MNCFQTITQFINTDDFDDYILKKYNKNACHFFSLKTAYEFMKKKEGSKTTHEANIYFAINMNKIYQNHDMYFDEVVKFTNLKQSDILATTAELLKSGDYPIDLIFPTETNKSYCVIILKNAKYFTILCNGDIYYVRDCHEPFQYEFSSRNELINHLNKTYQFNESVIVDNYAIPEFSSIEYIVINNPFEFKNGILENGIVTNKEKKSEKEVVLKETEFGISIGQFDYDNIGCDSVNTDVNKINNKSKYPEIEIKYKKFDDYEIDEHINNMDIVENDEEIGGDVLIAATTY